VQTKALTNLFSNFYKNKKVLVTGGCGFIGSHLVQELVRLGSRVYVIDDLSTGRIENLNSCLHKIIFFPEDLKNLKKIDEILKNQFPIVFHLGAVSSVPLGEKNPSLCWDTNVIAFANLLDTLSTQAIPTTVTFSSSSSVYGQVNHPSSEQDQTHPASNYAKSKLEGEKLLEKFAFKSGNYSFSLRYFNVFGDGEQKSSEMSSVFAKFKNSFYKQTPINIFGTGYQLRDYVPVSKVVTSNLLMPILAQNKAIPQYSVFNVASGKSITLFELISQIEMQLNLPVPQLCFFEPRNGDVINSIANCKKLDFILESFLKMDNLQL